MRPGEVQLVPDEAAQRALGARLAPLLPRGGVLFLEGELGAGKTTLTQGLLAALGFHGAVTSPTYALMQQYPTPAGQVLHVDAYRVRQPAELWEMDLEVLVESSRLSVIEWGEALYADFPQAWLLRLEHLPAGDQSPGRQVTRLR